MHYSRDAIVSELRAGIARRGVTQAALARALGMTEKTLTERMSTRMPFDLDELAAACQYLDLTLDVLFPATEPAPAYP